MVQLVNLDAEQKAIVEAESNPAEGRLSLYEHMIFISWRLLGKDDTDPTDITKNTVHKLSKITVEEAFSNLGLDINDFDNLMLRWSKYESGSTKEIIRAKYKKETTTVLKVEGYSFGHNVENYMFFSEESVNAKLFSTDFRSDDYTHVECYEGQACNIAGNAYSVSLYTGGKGQYYVSYFVKLD